MFVVVFFFYLTSAYLCTCESCVCIQVRIELQLTPFSASKSLWNFVCTRSCCGYVLFHDFFFLFVCIFTSCARHHFNTRYTYENMFDMWFSPFERGQTESHINSFTFSSHLSFQKEEISLSCLVFAITQA